MKKNLFIALEGIDGSGKSTQSLLLTNKLKNAGHKVHTTFEPTDGPIGSLIRNIFKKRIEADHRTIAGLFVADRLDHLLNKTDGIIKKLEDGYTVITDRYYLSSYAYQGIHAPLDWVMEANSLSAEILKPDLNIFIDIDPKISMDRINKARSTVELYESTENLKKVRAKYFEVFDLLKDKESIFITNGNRTETEIADDIWAKVQSEFK
jgi:dTMP kinase